MAEIFPFRGVMPAADAIMSVATPPYDVMSRSEAVAMTAGNPRSFLRVTRSEVDLPDVEDVYAPAVYQKARDNYQTFKKHGILQADVSAAYYIYRLVMDGRAQTGVVAAAAVDDYDQDVIKKHEKTRQAKEDDRTRHILATQAQTGPVFLTCRGTSELADVIAATVAGDPIRDFTADDGVSHTLWRVTAENTGRITAAFAAIPVLYIADGHHRAASASRARAACRDKNPGHTGDEEYNRFLTVIFPAAELAILAYNRVVKDLNGHSAKELMVRISAVAEITPTESPRPASPGTCAMYLEQEWYTLRFKDDSTSLSVVDQLDVSRLQHHILAPLLGIEDPRTSDRVDFIGGIRGTEELERRVNSGDMAVAFSMFPTTVDQLMAISDAGAIMPPKSTWFEPKLRDAVVIHEIG
ncbi:MAG: DUF1015 family protein [Lentisphaeria bacterium]|nr:DUF1015 family protein [Lentisphaeria bacterium]